MAHTIIPHIKNHLTNNKISSFLPYNRRTTKPQPTRDTTKVCQRHCKSLKKKIWVTTHQYLALCVTMLKSLLLVIFIVRFSSIFQFASSQAKASPNGAKPVLMTQKKKLFPNFSWFRERLWQAKVQFSGFEVREGHWGFDFGLLVLLSNVSEGLCVANPIF